MDAWHQSQRSSEAPFQMAEETALVILSSSKVFQGVLTKYKFKVSKFLESLSFSPQNLQSNALGGLETQFNLFLPQTGSEKVPILVYLAGLTCTEDNG
jgi:hypothetical protein